MLMAVMILLGVYLIACYTYGMVLLVKLARRRKQQTPAAFGTHGDAPAPHAYPTATDAPARPKAAA